MKTKHVILLLVAVFAIAYFVGDTVARKGIKDGTTTEVEVDTVYITKIDSTGIRPVQPKVIANAKPVKITIPNLNTTIATDSIEVNTTKYVGKEVLDNGTIDYEIYADNLVATNFKLTTEESVITKTITNTVVLPARSKLYGVLGTDLNIVTKLPQTAEAGLMYIRRNKWGVGITARHDFSGLVPPQNATTIGVKVLIGL